MTRIFRRPSGSSPIPPAAARLGRTALAILAALSLLTVPIGLPGCILPGGGTEIPDELTGRVRLADGSPAAAALVKLYPVGYLPGDSADSVAPAFRTTSGAGGVYAFRDVPAGMYHVHLSKDGLKAFRDSVAVTGEAQTLPPDTLRKPGSLTGRVVLQPDHDFRTAVVQVLGSEAYLNVDREGWFTLADLAPGRYRLRAQTTLEKYTPAYLDVEVRSGRSDTLAAPIRPFYSGTPVVLGLTAAPGPAGTLVLRWNRPEYDKVDGYLVYRDSAGTLLPSRVPYATTADTFWIDTVYSRTPRPGQHDYLDTLFHSYTYRVAILDKSGNPGPLFASIEAKAVPPSLKFVSGRWNRALEAAPFGKRMGHSLVVHNDRLWMLGAKPDFLGVDIWSSPDGMAWRQELANAPFPAGSIRALAHQGRLWVLVDAPYFTEPGSAGKNQIWNSVDGVAWSRVTDSPSFPARAGAQFLVHGDKLVVMSGYVNGGMLPWLSDAWVSADGASWNQVNTALVSLPNGNATSFLGRIWVLGGGFLVPADHNTSILSSPDGAVFTPQAAPQGLLPRTQLAAALHARRLWLAGGTENTGVSVDLPFFDDVWSSPDGVTWTLIDAHAPFGGRHQMAMASFRGKLWVSGGIRSDGVAADLWFLQEE